MDSIESRINALEARLEQVESELAIRNIIARYGLAVDCGDISAALACHTPDALYIVSAPRAGRDSEHNNEDLHLQGHAAIASMLSSDLHQSLLPNCAHTVGPLTVEIDIAKHSARATGYSRLYHRIEGNPSLMRLAVNEWKLENVDGRWLIAYRESRLMGEEQASRLLQQAAYR